MRVQVVVVGGGALGTSCFYHLVERGVRDVVLVEQGSLVSGSSGRSAAVVETQYLSSEKIALTAWSMRVFRSMIMDYVPGIEREGLYFRDDTPGRLIAGLHWEGYGDWERPENPDAYRQDSDWDYAARVAELLARRYRGATRFAVKGGWAGLYPLTPDSRPIIGEVAEVRRFYNAIGAGGVGVQTSPAIGAIVADLVTKGETAVVGEVASFRLERFESATA